jgi:hypothetical protein
MWLAHLLSPPPISSLYSGRLSILKAASLRDPSCLCSGTPIKWGASLSRFFWLSPSSWCEHGVKPYRMLGLRLQLPMDQRRYKVARSLPCCGNQIFKVLLKLIVPRAILRNLIYGSPTSTEPNTLQRSVVSKSPFHPPDAVKADYRGRWDRSYHDIILRLERQHSFHCIFGR